jgi:predicted transposase/invertase (TIGR01784 family)
MGDRTLISFDYAVKFLLRDKANFGILNGFLSELLGKKVVVEAVLESESNKVAPDEKTNRVDLKARFNTGELAVFEIQFHQAEDFFSRVLFGVSKTIVEQVSAGNVYGIEKVYSINIAYYNMDVKREYLFLGRFGGFKGVHFEDEIVRFAAADAPDVDIHPEYYLILPNMFDGNLRGRFDEWIYILRNSAVREDFTADGIEEAKIKLDLLHMSPADREAYEKYMENRENLNSAFRTAEKNKLEEGRKEGKIEVAKTLKDMGADADYIARATGFTVDEIMKLEVKP